MASKKVELVLAIVLVAALLGLATAQSSCTNVLMNLAPCLNYITGNSSTPSSNCCSQLNSVVQSSPQCLCSVVNGGAAAFGITINQTLALSLPGACNVKTPPLSSCQGKPRIRRINVDLARMWHKSVTFMCVLNQTLRLEQH